MNSITRSLGLRQLVVVAAFYFFAAVGAAQPDPIVPPTLTITLNVPQPGANLGWFGDSGVAYQLQSSPDLITWTNLGAVITGTGNYINVTQPIAGQARGFFRLLQLPATATFNPATGVLTIIGDDYANSIIVRRNAAGLLQVNGGLVPITGGTPTVANTTLIEIYGRGSDDQITLDQAGGALPTSHLFGEAGNDTLTGGSGGDQILGGPGDDILLGKGGADLLIGGDHNDTLTGGDADDQVYGGEGSDRFIWNPGDDTDLNEGGNGTDFVEVNGGGGAEVFTVTANGTRVRFDRLDPAPFAIDLGTCESLSLNANGGNDTFSATGNLAALILLRIDGGAGDDTLLGSNGIDVLLGGDHNDFIDGQQGNDVAFLGAGNDTFQWDPGDGSDTVEGQAGDDTLLFNGSNGAEIFDVFANGGRVIFFRNLGNIAMDLDDIEHLELNTLGSADIVTVWDLAGTDFTGIVLDLAAFGGAGDAQADTVIINGTATDDIVTATLPAGDLLVSGLTASVVVDGFEPTLDTVRIQGLAGDDLLDVSAVGPGGPPLTLDGGAGHDILLGSASADTLFGGDQDDVLLGNGGTDTLDGGSGDNILMQDGSNVTTGIVTVFGNAQDNTITLSRNAAGAILSNGVPIPGATVANTTLIRVFGQGGNDTLTLNEASGALPAALLFGGAGLDTLTGGSGGDLLFGGSGHDTVLGKGGFDLLFGGAGNDTLTGGDADDQVFGEADTDRFIWNPGDDTDLNEGGGGTDTVEVNGGGGAEVFTATANGTRVRFDRLDPAPFAIDLGTCENLLLRANGGNDSFSATGNLAALIKITADGGAGDDTLLGSNGADVLLGGDNHDFIDGQQGNDTVFLGAGDDTFQWDPGDGSDTIEGQTGSDTLRFNGSNAGEIFAASANGGRVLFTRNIGTIVMDLDDIERLDLNALGAVDLVTIHHLAGTDLTAINVNLASLLGGATGDGQPDTVVVHGTDGADTLAVAGSGTTATVIGLPTVVTIITAEAANDRLTLHTLGGADTVLATGLAPGVIGLTVNGGPGNDTLTGSGGSDLLNGDEDRDLITGGGGNDTVQLGVGDDRFIWNPGDDTDVVEGGEGTDLVEVNGDNSAEQFTVTANGLRVRFDRLNPAPFALDLGTCENLLLNAKGGNDSFSCTGNLAALIHITADGGTGDDTLLGSNGADVLLGGDNNDFIDGQQGSDTAFLGAGNDTFQWDPGDGSDVVEGQTGTDTLLFNGSAGSEIFTASANGGRVLFTRNFGSIVMDFDDVERLDLNALGGTDSATVNSLAGTDLTRLTLNLSGTIGGSTGDAAVDTITVNGSASPDTISLVANAGVVEVNGLAAQVRITRSEVANDDLIVNGLGGTDAFALGAGVTALIGVTTNQ